ncbi:Ovipostatin 1 [Biomphalaria glabrata]|nr:Ovipostatin 1 [Biomphalaria glabrata]
MKIVLLISVISVISFVSCTQDSVPICLPYLLQSFFVRFETSDYGVQAWNFVTNMAAKYTISKNIRRVYNLTEHVAYDIDLKTGSCEKVPMKQSEVIARCLPSSARQYSPNDSFVGYGQSSLPMQAFEVDLAEGGLARVAFTVSEPAFILASQLTGFSSERIESYFYFDSSMTASPDFFVLPPSCP